MDFGYCVDGFELYVIIRRGKKFYVPLYIITSSQSLIIRSMFLLFFFFGLLFLF
jgi:hypothetical protein